MQHAFISMPMSGLDMAGVLAKRRSILEKNGWEDVYDLCFTQPHIDICNPVENLGLSIHAMGKADVIYFVKGWKEAKGCRVEHAVCKSYKLMKKVVYEE